MDRVSKEQEMMAALAVVLVVEVLMQTVPEVAMHRHLVKVMMVEIVVVADLVQWAVQAAVVELVQLVAIAGLMIGTPIIAKVVTVEQVQLLQSQVHL